MTIDKPTRYDSNRNDNVARGEVLELVGNQAEQRPRRSFLRSAIAGAVGTVGLVGTTGTASADCALTEACIDGICWRVLCCDGGVCSLEMLSGADCCENSVSYDCCEEFCFGESC